MYSSKRFWGRKMGNWINMVFLHLGPPAVSSGLFLLGTADLALHCVFLLRTLDQAVSLMSSIFSREHTSFSPLPLALLCPLILKCAIFPLWRSLCFPSLIQAYFVPVSSPFLSTSELWSVYLQTFQIAFFLDWLDCTIGYVVADFNW